MQSLVRPLRDVIGIFKESSRSRKSGDLLISPVAHRESLKRMGTPPDERRNVGAFSEGQRRYLEYHRGLVFLEARASR